MMPLKIILREESLVVETSMLQNTSLHVESFEVVLLPPSYAWLFELLSFNLLQDAYA